ncbi:YdeI/OmpD-associated family protein [Paenibacillus spongiae]|uniref:YdeI/OmpD-associated family protein n=1 Tax=Paenibacillus spongiae TaxID=2909671 RepID=A0ABY5S9V8_9BACL|nr:YdeI/OmpD-associated family protein [Paenibacillus spongiae]UVI29575.1 YdeI/OmpD-associated family protein [Paenibacillus spongiae]
MTLMWNKQSVHPIFFANPAEFREWLEKHHQEADDCWVGYYKKGTGRPSMTWPESVDEALCLGWIDGIRKGIDAYSYTIRFTSRKPSSIWSAVNIQRVAELEAEGRMRPEGMRAFEQRKAEKSAIYSHEQKNDVQLSDSEEEQFRANEKAWRFFQSMPASYRKAAIWLIVSAKREETRRKRLAELIEDSANERKIKSQTWSKKPE